ncbi:hypothetical protein EYF80_056322 [Liparis tanakae]|uniref:Uncharacterized protein n=1 Tax=Liparis tanakae TaxID=230148 RepID=A0A4Z2EYS1_9TELE|nr:hypothetical protein EYF80_056322 [Liparis tanakae]
MGEEEEEEDGSCLTFSTALQPASLVPADPSCCLIAQREAITLNQHNTLAVSLLRVVLVPHRLTDADVMFTAAPVKLHNDGVEVEV